jgi:hypothetical protein
VIFPQVRMKRPSGHRLAGKGHRPG